MRYCLLILLTLMIGRIQNRKYQLKLGVPIIVLIQITSANSSSIRLNRQEEKAVITSVISAEKPSAVTLIAFPNSAARYPSINPESGLRKIIQRHFAGTILD